MEVSWAALFVNVAAVLVSAAIARAEGNWTRRPGLAMGFANHGGMWSDLVLLSLADSVIVPHLTFGAWLAAALLLSTLASLWVHRHWYTPRSRDDDDKPLPPAWRDERLASVTAIVPAIGGDHIWPSHARGSWWRDLSRSGWAHVLYVIGQLTLLFGFLFHAMPIDVVVLVAAIFTIHIPIGLLQPRWFRTGHIATVQEQPLLAPLLLALWAVTFVKLG